MSYSILIVDDKGDCMTMPNVSLNSTIQVIHKGEPPKETTAEIKVTYNYAEIFHKVLNTNHGIRCLDNCHVDGTIELLQRAYDSLEGEPSNDYWEATEGNVKATIKSLLVMAKACPNGYWRVH